MSIVEPNFKSRVVQWESIFEWLSSVDQSYSSALPGAGLGRGSERKGVFSDGFFMGAHSHFGITEHL